MIKKVLMIMGVVSLLTSCGINKEKNDISKTINTNVIQKTENNDSQQQGKDTATKGNDKNYQEKVDKKVALVEDNFKLVDHIENSKDYKEKEGFNLDLESDGIIEKGENSGLMMGQSRSQKKITFRFKKFKGSYISSDFSINKDDKILIDYNGKVEEGNCVANILNSEYEIVLSMEYCGEKTYEFTSEKSDRYTVEFLTQEAKDGKITLEFRND
ncbi:hypothetical protein [Oceanirhabdus seepicola]|uniref:Lipoprotein n=1 Tax=Oceanirhabdus seepicola TaxID=2828781 RepID=A0A9J6P7F7_9CLOT|nr:hypothetical protein [Oceanirhabdus seepicola]MCM1992563.1 hypothetical protein [Oceanirhabdus seepicola]